MTDEAPKIKVPGYLLDANARDLTPEVIDERGLPRVMPASYYLDATQEERSLLCVRHGLYLLPTTELVDWLREFIGDRSAIEIGAGNGVLAAALGIPATDSYLQREPQVAAYYSEIAQPPVRYGPNVECVEAKVAVRKYRPQIVMGAWVTHRYNQRRHAAGGNQYGPDTDWILQRVRQYVLIGNEHVARYHPLWKRAHAMHRPRWLYSRALNGSPDFIAVWDGKS